MKISAIITMVLLAFLAVVQAQESAPAAPAPYPAAYQANPPPIIRFGNTDFSSSDAIWITSYNGWGSQINPYPVRARYPFTPSSPPGLTIAPEAQTMRWFWNAPLNPDEFYIRKIERQLEADSGAN